jgi:hypothetical protein
VHELQRTIYKDHKRQQISAISRENNEARSTRGTRYTKKLTHLTGQNIDILKLDDILKLAHVFSVIVGRQDMYNGVQAIR